jgi:CheY-like chemotaxis protein/signal transduction histidine kinase
VKQLSQNAQQRKNKESAINPARLVNSSQGSSGDDKTREYNNIVEWLEATKDAMVMIISRCVDVNQALSGLPLTPNYGQVHLHEEVNNIVQFFRDESPQVRIRVQWKPHREGDSSLPDNFWSNVVTDRVWFIQSLHCYVENAVKFSDYTSHAQHEVEVDLSLVTSCEPATLNHFAKSVMAIREKNAARLNASQEVSRPASPSLATFKFIRIEVRDSGIGVSPAMRPFLFGFSHHQETQMKVGGAGLGLFSVHSRIHALGGKVGYQPGRSNDGTEKGSVFWFEVPYEQDKFLESRMEGKFSDMHNRRIENKNNSEKVEKSQTKLDLQHKLAKQILRDGSIRIGDIESDAIGESQPMLHDNIDATSPNDSVHKTEVISEGSPTVVLPCSLDSQAKSSESSSAEDSHKVSFREIQNASSVLPSVISLQAVSKIPGYQIHDGEQENSLPTSGPSDVDSTSVTSAVSIASNRTPRRMTKLKILVVDDSLPIRKICSVILNQNGHFVETASNGKEALQKMVASLIARRKYESDQRNLYTPAENKNNDNTGAQYDAKCGELDNSMACRVSNSTSIDDIVNSSQSSTIYDLVLMDIQMPVMDGIEAVTRYRAFEKEQLLQHVLHSTGLSAKENGAAGGHLVDLQLPIIAMSASSDSAIISKAIAEGMSHFIAKPFQMHQFETIISEIMY